MVYLYVREVLLFLVAWAVFIRVRYWYRWRVFKKWGLRNGCEEVPVFPNKLPWGLERYAFLVNGQMSSRFPFLVQNFEFVPAYHASLKLESASKKMTNDYPEIDLLEDIIRARFTEMDCWTFRFFNSESNCSSLNIS
jgi:hypothetical protein